MKYKIISINPGIDEFRYYESKSDAESDRNVIRIERKIGSKGANCALALAGRGEEVEYFTVGRGDYGCDSYLANDRIKIIRTVSRSGERVNVKLIYPDGGINGMIEKNGNMSGLNDFEKAAFFASVTESAISNSSDFSTYLFTGSLPPNVEKEEYLRCISHLSSLGRYVVLDGRGSLISAQSENFASLIKPNRDEFHDLCRNVDILKSFQPPVDNSPDFYTEYLRAALRYVEKYGSAVLLTLGEAGLVYASESEQYIKKAIPIKLRYPAGSGDRLLSYFLYYKRSKGSTTEEALDRAMIEFKE